MSYQTYVTGSVTVTPKLSDTLIDNHGLQEDGGGSDLIAESGGEDDTVGVVDGELTVIPGKSFTLITPRYEEPYNASSLSEEFSALVSEAVGHGHTFVGALYGSGEDALDVWRLRVDSGKAVEEKPKLVWPNGDEGWG